MLYGVPGAVIYRAGLNLLAGTAHELKKLSRGHKQQYDIVSYMQADACMMRPMA